jgi:hypothetical protein
MIDRDYLGLKGYAVSGGAPRLAADVTTRF